MADNGNITEQAANASTAGGQPAQTAPQGGEPAAQPQEQAPLTSAQIEEMLERKLAQVLGQYSERQSRAIQSQLDKREAGITKRMRDQLAQAEKFAAIAKQGGIDEKQAAALQGAFVNDTLRAMLADEGDEEQDDRRGRRRAAPENLDDEERDPISAQGDFIWNMSGLEEGDPEVKGIVTNGTPQQYLNSIYQAGIKKVLRLQGQGGVQSAAPQQPKPPAGPASLPAIGVDGSRVQPKEPWRDLTGGDLWRAADEYERKRRQQG
jgi:hypothetical protein